MIRDSGSDDGSEDGSNVGPGVAGTLVDGATLVLGEAYVVDGARLVTVEPTAPGKAYVLVALGVQHARAAGVAAAYV